MTLMLRWPCRASAYHEAPFGEMAANSWVGLHGILWVGARSWGLPKCWECSTGVQEPGGLCAPLAFHLRDHAHENPTSRIRQSFGNCTEPLNSVRCEIHRGKRALVSDRWNGRLLGSRTHSRMLTVWSYGGDNSMRKYLRLGDLP